MMRHATGLAVTLTLTAWLIAATAGTVRAAVSVGDTPNIEITALDGTKITSQDLKGRLVIVDFWATWCGPCVASVPHMIELNNRYAAAGVQVIGISRDNDRRALEKFVQRRRMNWPQYYDPNGTAAMSREWGVSGIPRIFIISPGGEVLWTGHPARMDEPFKEALKTHPPTPPQREDNSPSAVQMRDDAVDALRQARVAVDQGDAERLLELINGLPGEVLEDRRVLANARVLFAKLGLNETITESLETAKEANPEAAEKFAALNDAVENSAPISEEDNARPAVHPRLVASKLEQAEKAREAGKHYRAYTLYDWLLDRASETEAGHIAAQRIAEYEADETIITEIRTAEAQKQAEGLLSLAENYIAAGNFEEARATYEKLLENYEVAADCCDKAREALAKMD